LSKDLFHQPAGSAFFDGDVALVVQCSATIEGQRAVALVHFNRDLRLPRLGGADRPPALDEAGQVRPAFA
jgi:hypothetical protein